MHDTTFKLSLWLLSLFLFLTGCASKKSDYEFYFPPGLEPGKPLNYSASYSNQLISVQQIDLKIIANELPPHIRLRFTLPPDEHTRLEALTLVAGEKLPEGWMKSDYDYSRLRCFQASDGLSYLVDHHEMALYYRHGTNAWTNAIKKIPIVKASGGSWPGLHIRYLGANKFLFPETLPSKPEPMHWSKADIDPKTGWTKRAPYECVTSLFDCVEKRVLARSEPKTYDPEPSITLSEEWKTQYGIRFEPWWMQHDPGDVAFMRPRSRQD
ncbi:MAG: hypothetical protein K0Q55_350 [Verrucomicrobia bacterium]|jgi:hypothetical protein|nr:hypothetical protein [Verrucomicrobiota bacterium]